MPPFDDKDAPGLEVVNVTWDGDWTSVTFVRSGSGDDVSVSVGSVQYGTIRQWVPVSFRPLTPTASFNAASVRNGNLACA